MTLSYRSDAFSRVKVKNRTRLDEAQPNGRVRVIFNSNVTRIEKDTVLLKCADGDIKLPNDAVIVSAGGVLPIDLLKKAGIQFETKHGTA